MSKYGLRLLVPALFILLVLLFFPGTVLGSTNVHINLDGRPVATDVPPYIDENSRTIVPARFISEELGYAVDWDSQKREVVITGNSSVIELFIDQKVARVNGDRVEMEAPAVLKNGRTMVPIRFIAEAFGMKVSWAPQARTVNLSSRLMPPAEFLEGDSARVIGSLVNVRTGPGTDYPVVFQVSSGTELFLTGKTGDWYMVRFPGSSDREGWMAGWLIEKISSPGEGDNTENEREENAVSSPEPAPDPVSPVPSPELSLSSVPRSALVMKSSVNVRSSPTTESQIIGKVTYGTWLEILADQNRWYQVRLEDGRTGWVGGWLLATRYDPPGAGSDLPTNQKPGTIIAAWEAKTDSAGEQDIPVIEELQVIEMEQGVKLRITAGSVLDLPRIIRLSNPARLVFDFGGRLGDVDHIAPLEVGCRPVIRIRGSQFEKDTVRLVADLKESTAHSAVHQVDGRTIEVMIQPLFPLDKLVVIDPGHGTMRSGGGSDPGAIGPSGLTEREVVTAVSRNLGETLLSKGYSVVLTREEGTQLSLEERSHVANLCGGVFVSIHANAHLNRDVMGTETYYPGTQGGGSGELIATSKSLAEHIQKELLALLKRPDRGVKQANFAVLRHSHIPAALVEVAFISNPQEEKLLKQEDFQGLAALAIARGIENYLLSRR